MSRRGAYAARSSRKVLLQILWTNSGGGFVSFVFLFSKKVETFIDQRERRVSLLVASCGISTSSRNKFDEKRCWKREESHNNLNKREQEKARRCGPSLSINRANTREHA